MKHKHYDMIVAKAANMELVVFLENNQGWSEKENQSDIQFHEQFEYFLCHPQNKDATNHLLNGGKVLFMFQDDGWWHESCKTKDIEWSPDLDLMSGEYKFRIKPKKEKAWVLVNVFDNLDPVLFRDEGDAEHVLQGSHPNWSKHEIEVEV